MAALESSPVLCLAAWLCSAQHGLACIASLERFIGFPLNRDHGTLVHCWSQFGWGLDSVCLAFLKSHHSENSPFQRRSRNRHKAHGTALLFCVQVAYYCYAFCYLDYTWSEIKGKENQDGKYITISKTYRIFVFVFSQLAILHKVISTEQFLFFS